MLTNFLPLLFLSSAAFVRSQERIPPHTVCYSFWEELQRRPTNTPFVAQGQVRMIPGEFPDRRTSASTPNPFRNLIGSVEVSGDEETPSIDVCIVASRFAANPTAQIPYPPVSGTVVSMRTHRLHTLAGSSRDLVNKIRPTATPGTLTVVPIVDGCTMHIPSSRPDVGCSELWMTRGAFEAIGATKEEMDSKQMLLEWTFLDAPI
ncbi:secreted protein [Melampsora americana]|nr:secreted protein [Melampsora americana]